MLRYLFWKASTLDKNVKWQDSGYKQSNLSGDKRIKWTYLPWISSSGLHMDIIKDHKVLLDPVSCHLILSSLQRVDLVRPRTISSDLIISLRLLVWHHHWVRALMLKLANVGECFDVKAGKLLHSCVTEEMHGVLQLLNYQVRNVYRLTHRSMVPTKWQIVQKRLMNSNFWTCKIIFTATHEWHF